MAFWSDLTPKQRFAIPEENLERWVQAECMNEGIKPPVEPFYELTPVMPNLKTVTIFRVSAQYKHPTHSWDYTASWDFPTEEAARTFMGLGILASDTSDGRIVVSEHLNPSLSILEAVPRAALAPYRELAEQVNKANKANAELRKGYEEECAAVQRVRARIESEWCAAKRLNHRYTSIMNTFTEYVAMTENGNHATAFAFLCKSFDHDEVKAAFEWLDIPLPVTELPVMVVEDSTL